jgi:sorbitol-specific phosphotransferase system component IIC
LNEQRPAFVDSVELAVIPVAAPFDEPLIAITMVVNPISLFPMVNPPEVFIVAPLMTE